MSKLTSDEYKAKKGQHCPNCDSRRLSGESVDIEAGTASQNVTCDDCDAMWTDIYTLAGYTDLEA